MCILIILECHLCVYCVGKLFTVKYIYIFNFSYLNLGNPIKPMIITVAKNVSTSSSFLGFLLHSFALVSGWLLRYCWGGMFCSAYLVVSISISSFISSVKSVSQFSASDDKPGCDVKECARVSMIEVFK